ncbi:MAG: hypothetical protein H6R14_795 [Proteobacteria bacterium]|nr:hypothetical protein [Pseudomonadota bacterium]
MELDPKYQCCECGDIHDDEDDARECCAPRIKEVFVCPQCKEVFDDEDEAIECCDLPEGFEIRPSLIELEAAGQMRLLP